MTKSTDSLTPDFLYQALEGFYAYCALRAAFANRIFDHLSQWISAEKLAARLGKDAAIMAKSLNCLVVMGLAVQKDETFRNTPMAERYCMEDSPLCQRELFELTHDTFARVFLDQAPSLSPTEAVGGYGEAEIVRNNNAGIAFALPHTVEKVVNIIADLNCFKTAKRFLDLGAGHGLFAMAVAKRKPDLEVTVFDLPRVVDHTRAIARDYGMEDRLEFMGGDMLKGGVQGKFDIIFASDCICLARSRLVEFLSELRSRLAPGGVLILRNSEMAKPSEQSMTNVLLDLGAALSGYGDYLFRVGELPEILTRAGFTKIESTPLKHMTHHYVVHVAQQ